MKRRSLLALAASSALMSGTAHAQVSPNQPTVEPTTTPDTLVQVIQGNGWAAYVKVSRVTKVQPADGGQILVSFSEPEDAQILVITQHTQRDDVFMGGESGIKPGEDYFDTQLHIRTWKALRSKFRDIPPAVAIDDAGAPLEFLSHDHSWVVLYFEDKQAAEYFEVWSLPNNTTVTLHLGESFLENFNPSLGNLMYLRSAMVFDDVTFPESPVPFPNLT